MGTRGMLLFFISAFSVIVICLVFIDDQPAKTSAYTLVFDSHFTSATRKHWPELEWGWRLALATAIGFLGSAFGTVGGVGGGGIFVPMLTLVVGFDSKSAAALSKCMIMGASASSVWYNLRIPHPSKEVPIIDYDLALLFQPMLMLGITIGVALSVVFPYWLITVLIMILFLGTSSRSFYKGIEMWKQETITISKAGVIDTLCEPLLPKQQKSPMQIMRFNLRWESLSVLVFVWLSFLLLQVFKNGVAICSTTYWILFGSQFPMALMVLGYESRKLYKEHQKRVSMGSRESVCEATMEWTKTHIVFCALSGILGGTVGGLLGSGGGFILGPLLLEIGVIPQVASATSTFVMLFSSTLSVLEFYLLKRFPMPYALYLVSVSLLAGFWGQFFVRRLVTLLRRASIMVFTLSCVIFVSALTMGFVGTEKSIRMMNSHEFMGLLEFCSSQ